MQKNQSVLILISLLLFMCKRVQPRDAILITDIQASTELKSEDFRYAAVNVFDREGGHSWVEGKEGDGIGEHLKIQFAALSRVKEITFLNGFGDAQYWNRNNRVKELSIETEKGLFKTITLADTREKQSFRFEDFAAEALTLRIQSVYASGKDPDTAIAEIIISGAQLDSVLEKKIVERPLHGLYTFRTGEPDDARYFLLLQPEGKCRALSLKPPTAGALAEFIEVQACSFSVTRNHVEATGGNFAARFQRAPGSLVILGEFLSMQSPHSRDEVVVAGDLVDALKLRKVIADPVAGESEIQAAVSRWEKENPAPCSGVHNCK